MTTGVANESNRHSGVVHRLNPSRFSLRIAETFNVVKVVLLVAIVAALAWSVLAASSDAASGVDLLPRLPEALGAVGALGLVTALGSNIAWQFVDNSSWLSQNSGRSGSRGLAGRDLRWAGLTIALAPPSGSLRVPRERILVASPSSPETHCERQVRTRDSGRRGAISAHPCPVEPRRLTFMNVRAPTQPAH